MKISGRFVFLIIILLIFGYIGYEMGAYVKHWIAENGYLSGKMVRENVSDNIEDTDRHIGDSIELFPKTGRWIGSHIKELFYSVNNPLEVFGYPITDEFIDKETGVRKQYFEKARMEYRLDVDGNEHVVLTPLGEMFYETGEPIKNPSIGGCKNFGNSEFKVCHAFLEFYESNGGERIFGEPISSFQISDGWIVQYFKNSKFEWRPNSMGENAVHVSNLGEQYFHLYENKRDFLEPLENNIPITLTKINISVSPGQPIYEQNDKMYIVAYTSNQYSHALPDVLLVIQVVFPDGTSHMIFPGTTDENGIASSFVELNTSSCGMGDIIVAAGLGDIMTETRTNFYMFCSEY